MRIMLVDDHILFRKGIVALLESRKTFEVVGEANDGLEALAVARKTLPDIILMDIHMPHCDGLEAIRMIKSEMPHIKIVILTVSDDNQDLFKAIKGGAQGYLLKNLEPRQLYDCLDSVAKGESALSGLIAAKILQEFSNPGPASGLAPEEMVDALTGRETTILQLVAAGKTNKEIAADLTISENTVKIHLRNILEKLHLKNRIQIAVYAARQEMASKAKNK